MPPKREPLDLPPMTAILLRQYRGAMAMFRKSLRACPDELWDWREEGTPIWHHAYHTLWFLDFYLCKSGGKEPPQPSFHFTHAERLAVKLTAAFGRKEMLAYYRQVAARCRKIIEQMSMEALEKPTLFPWHGKTVGDTMIYNFRHIQHHVGQINSILRRRAGIGMKWIGFEE